MKADKFMTRIYTLLIALCCTLVVAAQNALPTANPTMTYVDADGQEVSESQYDGSAPFAPPLRLVLRMWATTRHFMNGALRGVAKAPFFGAL